MSRVEKLQKQLPHRIIPLPCKDKLFHEDPIKLESNLADLPHPFRCLLLGSPNCGKSTIIKTLVMHQSPPFDTITVVHCDPNTLEYSKLTTGVQTHMPFLDDFDKDKKNLVIIDDVALKSLDKKEKARCDRLLGNWSTHSNISCCVASQQPQAVPPNVRRQCNFFCLWRSTDYQSLRDIAEKCGCNSDTLRYILGLLQDSHDSLMIDLVSNYKYRKNIWEHIQ